MKNIKMQLISDEDEKKQSIQLPRDLGACSELMGNLEECKKIVEHILFLMIIQL